MTRGSRSLRGSSVARHLLIAFAVEITVISALLSYYADLPPAIGVLWAAAIMVCVRLVAALASFAIAWWLRSETTAARSLDAARTVSMILRELFAVLRLFFVFHPLEPWLDQPEPADIVPDQPLVLLVHGFFSNAGFWWSLKRWLRRNGIVNIHTINLEPAFGDIDDYAEQLHVRIEQIAARGNRRRIVLVAHSMGGLVCRAYLRRHGDRRLAGVVTLGSPHHGTVLAWLLFGPNLRQMRPNSTWLRVLNTGEANARSAPITVIYSLHDNIVAPQQNGSLEGARNIALPGIGHLDMAYSPVIKQLLVEAINQLAETGLD